MNDSNLTILITGANSGMGLATAKELAAAGHTLILGVRKADALQTTIQTLQELTPHATLSGYPLDLASFESVRSFIQSVKKVTPKLDVLICNAGVMTPPYQQTVDGFESQYQINFLSHALLSIALEPLLRKGHSRKCIQISSLSGEKGTLDQVSAFHQMGCVSESNYDAMRSYRESKLAQTLFAKGQALVGKESGLWTASIHPGVVITNLFYRGKSKWYKWIMKPFEWIGLAVGFFVRPEQGAATAIKLAQSSELLPSGRYWHQLKERTGHPSVEENPALCIDMYHYVAQMLAGWENQ
jgi:retinol dehydrogenase-13